ncbi:MAG TPA: hypothetical protein VIV11_06130, partial [Kofleriaceae bacterium]
PGPYVLEGALDLATARLEPSIDVAIAAVARVRASRELARGKAEASGELRYYVDELEQRLTALEQLFGVAPGDTERDRDDDDEHEGVYERRLVRDAAGDRKEIRTRKRGPGKQARPPAARDAVVAGIAEVMLIERALPQLLDPDAHAATVLMSRIGAANGDGLVAVTQVFAHQKGWFEAGAIAGDDGEIGTLSTGRSTNTWDVWQRYWRTRRDVVIVERGLFVREALATDHGTWMLRAAAAEPDIVRVEVRGGAARPPTDVLKDHLAARKELERVLEHGGSLPPNPDVLLPVARTITSHAALLFSARPFAIEIEDFATGWSDRQTLPDVVSAIRRCWHLAWSRKGKS